MACRNMAKRENYSKYTKTLNDKGLYVEGEEIYGQIKEREEDNEQKMNKCRGQKYVPQHFYCLVEIIITAKKVFVALNFHYYIQLLANTAFYRTDIWLTKPRMAQ